MFTEKFFVNQEKGIVVCVIEDYALDTVRGIAKCDPNDVFDESVGKAIAGRRAYIKLLKRKASILKRNRANALQYLDNYDALISKNAKKIVFAEDALKTVIPQST